MTNDETALTPAEELTAVMGGTEVEVVHLDGSKEMIKVRELGADEIQTYALIIDDEVKSAELFCSKPDGWAKTLTPESFNKVMDTGQELNLPLFSAWFRRSMKRREATNPGISKMISENLEKVIASSLASPGSSSPSPSGTG
jgi:hypothetical protein